MKIKTIEGKLENNNYRFALISSRFNNFITDRLVDGAIDYLVRHDVKPENIVSIKAPGSFEVPKVTKLALESKKYDGIICLGSIIRGDTYHFDLIANEATKGLAQLNLESNTPISFGILTTETIEQAIERAGTKNGNKGFEAAAACLEMINLCELI
jgi:6,7-dimethyl-8-ribityllumazine synthase